jgi:hypothetical protein
MSKNYARKQADQRQQAALTATAAQAAPEVAQAATFAECIATYGLPYTVVLEGGSSLVLQSLMMRRGEDDVHVIQVVESSDRCIDSGFNVPVGQLAALASRGQQYRPQMDRDTWSENNKAALFDILLQLIKMEGGHAAFGAKVKSTREVAEIHQAVKEGEIGTDPMDLFNTKRINNVLIEVGEYILVVRSGYRRFGRDEKLSFELIAAPNGTPQNLFRPGVYTPVSDIFKDERLQYVMDFSKFIIDAIPAKQQQDFKDAVEAIADAEASVVAGNVALQQPAAMQVQEISQLTH